MEMTYFIEFKGNSIKLSAIYSVHDLTISDNFK